ncbi:MAG: FHA domain-containing protein [Deltaproteobacteria bacterium]|nr:FHA domain-containing protein [Deltaproteobacteria bacterium]
MARLILSLKGRELDKFVLGQGDVVLGRSPDCDIRIDNPAISRKHAVIENVGHGYVLTDQGSSNGTFLNGEPVKAPTPLKPGDVIGLAKFELLFQDTPRADMEKLVGSMDMEATVMVDSDAMAKAFQSVQAGTPTVSGPRKLVVLKGEANVKELVIERDVITIGKDDKCDLVVKGFFLDKIEATLTQKQGKFFLYPMGGGVKINEEKVDHEVALKVGDTFSGGKTIVAFT